MTDIRKVISSVNVPTLLNTTTYVKTPDSDRPVFYNSFGFLETDQPPVLSTVKVGTTTTAADAKSNAHLPILAGAYFATTGTLQASDLDPCRLLIRATSGGGNSVITFPNPGGAAGLIPYLKLKYGPDKVLPGLFYQFKFMNDQAANDVTLTVAAPGAGNGTVNTQGWDDTAAPSKSILLTGTTAKKPVQEIGCLIQNTTPGSETLTWYALN